MWRSESLCVPAGGGNDVSRDIFGDGSKVDVSQLSVNVAALFFGGKRVQGVAVIPIEEGDRLKPGWVTYISGDSEVSRSLVLLNSSYKVCLILLGISSGALPTHLQFKVLMYIVLYFHFQVTLSHFNFIFILTMLAPPFITLPTVTLRFFRCASAWWPHVNHLRPRQLERFVGRRVTSASQSFLRRSCLAREQRAAHLLRKLGHMAPPQEHRYRQQKKRAKSSHQALLRRILRLLFLKP